MTLDDLLNQEKDTEQKVNKVHSEIWYLRRLREMETFREFVLENNESGTHFEHVASECINEIKWVLKKRLYIRIQNAISDATESYTTYCNMCKECNLEPKKFNLDFSYDID